MKINVFLFEGFETLDACGPVEVLGKLPEVELTFYSKEGGIIHSLQKLPVQTKPLSELQEGDVFIIPGAVDITSVLGDQSLIEQLKETVEKVPYCLTICTGSLILAKTGALNGKQATTNKMAFKWGLSLGFDVKWIYEARWIRDSKYFTSSGVSAGIDMALGFVTHAYDRELAVKIANEIEYIWNEDSHKDPFARDEDLKK